MEAFPRPKKRADGSYIFTRPGAAGGGGGGAAHITHAHPQMLYKKRAYEDATLTPSAGAAKVQRVGGGGGGYTLAAMGSGTPNQRNVVTPKGRSQGAAVGGSASARALQKQVRQEIIGSSS